jgi:large subunit ribosomal protein L13
MFTQKTFTPKASEIKKHWYVVDAENQTVGRLASEIAKILKGKNKPEFATHIDTGDFVVVVNCEKVKFTGNKWDDKIYNWHTNHIGGIKARTAKEQLEKHPELIVYEAVKGMLSKNTLGRKQLTKLKVFKGATHAHEAQSPVPLTFNK